MSSARAGAVPLGRAELEAAVDGYLDALVARDPARLALAPGARFTENGQELSLGDGLWGSATPEPAPLRAAHVADLEAGQVALFASVAEHGQRCLVGVRLRLDEEGRLAEAEQLVCRPGHSLFDLFDPDGMARDRPHLREAAPARARATRAELEAVANAYFDGIEADDGSAIPVTDECIRFENGVQSVRRPSPDGGFGGGHLRVAEQISSGMFAYISAIRGRRYPICDLERGLVLAIGLFDHPGRLTQVEVAGIGTVELPPFAIRPSSALIFELFQVRSGTITAIEALLDFFPYGMRTGW